MQVSNITATEAKVLAVLKASEAAGKPTHAPALSRAAGGAFSVASAYTLLDRMVSRGVIARRDETVEVLGTKLKRVSYSSR